MQCDWTNFTFSKLDLKVNIYGFQHYIYCIYDAILRPDLWYDVEYYAVLNLFSHPEVIISTNICSTISVMSDTEDEPVVLIGEVESEYDSSEETNVVEDLAPSNPSFGEAEIAANYERLGTPVPPPPPSLNLLELRMQYPEQRVRYRCQLWEVQNKLENCNN